jgi:hypothetical protein
VQLVQQTGDLLRSGLPGTDVRCAARGDLSAGAVCTDFAVCAGSDCCPVYARDGSANHFAVCDLPERSDDDASAANVLSSPDGPDGSDVDGLRLQLVRQLQRLLRTWLCV